jgi:hypothetical protein
VKLVRTLALSALVLVAVGAGGKLAFTASSTVAASSVGTSSEAITAATLAPLICRSNGVTATSVRSGTGGTLTGTSASELLIGTRNNNMTINGGGGKDCIVAGTVPSGKRITMSPSNGSGSVCVAGPGPGSYTYGAGCAVKA